MKSSAAHQSPQPRSNNSNYFQGYVRVLAAKVLKIFPRNEQKLRILGRCRGGRIVSAVKYRKLCKGAPRPFYG